MWIYIFQLHDPENEDNADSFSRGLREIESVNAVFSIDLNTFRDKEFTISVTIES